MIAGAGPVGLVLALALRRAGVDVRIIDVAEGLSGASKAITIQPRTLEVLHLLGVAEELVAAGVVAGVMHMHVGRDHLTTLRYDKLPTAYPFYLHLHQGQTEALLAEALAARGVVVERGLGLVDYRQRGAAVEAQLRRADGSLVDVRCAYLAGCDGGHSQVRKCTGVDFVGERHRDDWIMADARIEGFELAPDERHAFMLEDYPFVILPMTDGYYRVIAARSADSPLRGDPPSLVEFDAIASSLGFRWRLHDPLWLTRYNPSQRIADRFRHGRVLLVGDAAHVNTPIGAQGLNTGVMDALNLGWKLAMAVGEAREGSGCTSELLLDSYHAERHPAVLSMFRGNDRLTRMVFGRNAALRKLARAKLRSLELGALNLRHTADSAQLSLSYAGSPALAPEDDHASVIGPTLAQRLDRALAGAASSAARLGDRAPCCPLRDRKGAPRGHVYELLSGRAHTLLVFDDGHPEVAKWADAVAAHHAGWLSVRRLARRPLANEGPEQGVWRDAGGEIAAAYGVVGRGAALVRPDAFVAARVAIGDERALDAYLARLGVRRPAVPKHAREREPDQAEACA
nr:FAD-dependent monooxygenase [Pseudenhygromyxa sp. WMMC2535]